MNETSSSDLGFVFNEIIQKVQFPIIYSDSEKTLITYKNLVEGLSEIELKNIIQSMDDLNEANTNYIYFARRKSCLAFFTMESQASLCH